MGERERGARFTISIEMEGSEEELVMYRSHRRLFFIVSLPSCRLIRSLVCLLHGLLIIFPGLCFVLCCGFVGVW